MSARPRPRPRETKRTASRHRILNLIFREPRCSRLHLARRLNINATTIGNYVDDFLGQGVLGEDHRGGTRRGRSPVPVWLNPAYGGFLGVDLEALRVRAVLVDFAGEVVAQQETGLRAGLAAEAVLGTVVDTARRTAALGGDRRLFAVGVAAPGRLDLARGRIVRYDLLSHFQDVPLLDLLRPYFDCPIYMEENIRALTLAELLRGGGRGHRHFICLAARSGFGMGLVIDGRIYAGHEGMAGKVGQTVFPVDGGVRTLTELVSAKGIVRQAIEALEAARKTAVRRQLLEKAGDLSLADLVAVAAEDEVIRGLLERVGRDLGLVAANLANVLAPEKILLAGEVPSCSPVVRGSLEEWFRRATVPEVLEEIELADGALSGYAAALGAAYLGFLKTFPEDEVPADSNGHSPLVAARA
jgi:N-acetylglucosamine repressor